MKHVFLALMMLAFQANAETHASGTATPTPTPTPVRVISQSDCNKWFAEIGQKGGSKIAKEMVELELSGYRWQGAQGLPLCFNRYPFETILPVRVLYGGKEFLKPKFTIKKNRVFTITRETWLDEFTVEVSFSYIGTKNDKDKNIRDQLVFGINVSENRRKLMGCVSVVSEPQHFVMREECVHD